MIREVQDAGHEDTLNHTLPPTDLIRLIHSQNRARFGQIFGADPPRLEQFWRSLFDSEDGREFKRLHPGLRDEDPEHLQTSIPLVIHEDAAPYGKKRSVNVLQWGPLLVNGSDIESRFVHHGYTSNKQAAPAATAGRAWEKFWDEVDAMAKCLDQRGTPITCDDDGTTWKFVFTFCENDFDMDVEHGLPNYKRAILFCKHCRCLLYTSDAADE